MSLIKKIKQFINGSWQEFNLNSDTLDNVVNLDSNQSIYGEKSFNSLTYFNQGLAVHREATIQIGDVSIGKDDNGLLYTTGDNGGKIATRQWVEGAIAGKVDYLGIVRDRLSLYDVAYNAGTKLTPGDYARASADFTLSSFSSVGQEEQVHSGDILIFKNFDGNGTPEPYIDYWDIIHTEDPGNYVTLNTDQTLAKNVTKTFECGGDDWTSGKLTLSGESMTMTDGSQYINFFPTLHVSSPKSFNFSPYGCTLVGDSYDDGVFDITPSSISVSHGNVGLSYQASTDNIIHTYNDELGLQAQATIKVPKESGTFALLSDIPDLSNYATLTGENEFNGANSFTGPLQAIGNSYITQYRTDSIFASQFGEEGTIRSYLKYPMGSGMLEAEQKIQQGVEGYIATREWAINKFANQMSWSQELIDSCVDLGGWTIRFNTDTYYETDYNEWPLTTWLISSGGYALGVGGPPQVQLKGIDGKQFNTITIAKYSGKTQWLLNKLILPDDFGHITKAVSVSGEPSAEYDAVLIYWDRWEHIMPGGFTKETVFDELKLIPALENTQNNKSAKLIIGGGNAPSGMPDSSVEISYNGIYFKEGVSSGSDWEISKSGTTIDQLTVNGTAAANCLYLAGPSTFGSFENLGGYIYASSNESIYALPIFNDGQKSDICNWFAASESNFNTIATQEWVESNAINSSTIDQEFFNSLY